jgi:hypothetical protein
VCIINLVSFISVPSDAARHDGGAGWLRCEALVPGAAVKETFLWRCVYDVLLLLSVACRGGWSVLPSAGQINRLLLPNRVGKYTG